MKGYWIARIDVTDEALYPEYGKRALPAIEKFGGRFIVRSGRATTPEGLDWARNVVIAFDSYEQALACYDSPEYQAAPSYAKRALDRELFIVEGASNSATTP